LNKSNKYVILRPVSGSLLISVKSAKSNGENANKKGWAVTMCMFEAKQLFDEMRDHIPRITDQKLTTKLGRKLECNFFGYSYLTSSASIKTLLPTYSNLTIDQAVLVAKLSLPENWNTTKCPGWIGKFYRLVRHSLKEELRKLPSKGIPLTRQMGRLEFIPALGTPLDIVWGADGFFTFAGEIVAIDVTVNPGKFSSLWSPVVISAASFSRRTNQKYRINLAWTLAREVARRLIVRIIDNHMKKVIIKNVA